MPDPDPAQPKVDDTVVKCAKCERQFNSYRWRIFKVNEGEAKVLVDRDGLVIYDLVLVCSCSTVFHHHTKEETLKRHAELYQSALDAYEKLMQHYRPPLEAKTESAIIASDNSTG